MSVVSSKNLHYKLVAYLFLASVVFVVIMMFISFRLEINHANSKAEVMVNQLMDMTESTAAIAAYSNNTYIAKDVVEGLLRNAVVHKAIITSNRGFFLERTKNASKDATAENQEEISRELLSPFGDKESIGQLSITPSADFSLQEAKYVVFNNAINAFILIGFTSLVLLLLLYCLFSSPLERISNALRDIIVGDQERINPLTDNKNDEIGYLIVNINKILDLLTTKLSTQRVLRKHIEAVEKKLRNIFQSTSAGLFLLDRNGCILTCTPTLLKILNYQDSSLIAINGQNFANLFFKEPEQFQKMMRNALEMEQLEAEDLMLHNDTTENPLWVYCLLSKIVDEFGITRFEGVIFDISKRVASEKATQYEANHDALTGLLRRNAAELQLKKHIASANNAATVVLLLDLDGFKKANDTYGHDVGDLVLVETAKRLESCVRHNDIVCRLGGDEFLIILFDCDHVTTGFNISEQIIATLSMPIAAKNQVSVNIGVSIGISLFPMHGTNVEDLLKSADEAMYEVKRRGKNGYGIRGKNGVVSVNRPLAQKRDYRTID